MALNSEFSAGDNSNFVGATSEAQVDVEGSVEGTAARRLRGCCCEG